MADDKTTLASWITGLPLELKGAAYSAVKTVIDKHALAFGRSMNSNMSLGMRNYSFVNVHTNTKLDYMERTWNSSNYYGWHFLFNGAGYKTVPWHTNTGGGNGHQIAFDLIANVTSTGRKRKGKKGNYEGTHFIPRVVKDTLTGMDDEIMSLFNTYTKDI